MMLNLFLFASMVAGAEAHGYFFEPDSRTKQARFSSPVADYCPHCSLASPMTVPKGRNWPGNQAFASPGEAPSVTHIMHGGIFGVCGYRPDNDFNIVTSNWGYESVQTVKQGEVIDVSWCVNADHGGVYSYRLCRDPSLTQLFRSGTPPSFSEQEEAEACFQETVLRCDDVASNDCELGPQCDSAWECAADPGKYFHCRSGGSWLCDNSGEDCQDGKKVKGKVQIPFDFPTGETLLSWRWDSQQTTEVFAGCADITVIPGDGTTPAPAPAPVPEPVTPPTTPAPSATPVDPVGVDVCCWTQGTIVNGECDFCTSYKTIETDPYCGLNAANCEGNCNGDFCKMPSLLEPSASPVAPPPAFYYDQSVPFCCMLGGCNTCIAPVLFDSAQCGTSETACYDCGGQEYCPLN